MCLLRVVALAVSIAAPCAALASINLVANPSFEQTDPKGNPRYYGLFLPDAPAGNPLGLKKALADSIQRDAQHARSGTYALRIASAEPVRCSINQARFPVVGGQRIRVSGWVKGEGLAPVGTMPGAVIRLAFGNTDSTAQNAEAYAGSLFLKAPSNDFDWTQLSGEVVVPEAANQMILGCFLWESSGTVWFDDLSIEVVDGPQNDIKAIFDPNGLLRYREANAQLQAAEADMGRVVFYGDSITDGWQLDHYFPGEGFVNRGIAGQDISQMLARMEQDVLALDPAVVWFLGGTNDIARGFSNEDILANARAFARQCRAHDIRLVICSVLPISDYHAHLAERLRRSELRPPQRITEINEGLRQIAAEEGAQYLDLFAVLADAQGLLPADLSNDGLHPNGKCYGIMAPHVLRAVKAARPTAAGAH